jgi:hypothetical protein
VSDKVPAGNSRIANQAASRGDEIAALAQPTIAAWGSKAPGITNTLGSQIQEALSTGGVGAQIPIINRAQEGSRQATSNALRGVDDAMGKFNLAGTPYGEALRGNVSLAGEQQTNRIPTDVAGQFIQGAMPFISGSPGAQTALGGIAPGTAVGTTQIGAETAANVAGKQATSQMVSALLSAVGGMGAAAAKGGG